ncbi:hypothetical protein AALA80_11250 [Oscillospiraceae bacterium 50-60]
MTAEDVIKGFREDAPEDAERAAYANELFQEAIRLGMELNNQYHTPEEIREIMGRLTGKEIAPDFRLFPPFYTDFGKNIAIGRDVFINSGCHFQDQGGIEIGDGALIGHNVVLATINHDLDPARNRKNHYAPIRPCLKNVKTLKRWIFIRHSALNFLAGHQPGKKICLDWRKNFSPLGIPPFFKQGLKSALMYGLAPTPRSCPAFPSENGPWSLPERW